MQRFCLLVVLLLPLFAGGCGPGSTQPWVSHSRLQRGLVIVLPGIEGRSAFNEAIAQGLAEGGVNYGIEIRDWTPGGGAATALYTLRAQERNRLQAEKIADRVIDYMYDYPGRPIYLVGQSGGGAMALWVAESLPPGYSVDGIVLIAASISPNYRLDLALKHSQQGIVSFRSERDVLMLGLGTTVVGTMDGEHSASAGMQGFKLPTGGASARLYQKFYEVSWTPEMSKAGNVGLHLTSGATQFVVEFIAPLVTSRVWDRELLGQVMHEKPASGSGAASPPPASPPPPPAPRAFSQPSRPTAAFSWRPAVYNAAPACGAPSATTARSA
jgi:pimeloyl-ACP methyl ester carboxylesterase